ncbi:hypothetical protein [Treponema phagedenis]|uniref:hypothetical protein n=1 Tax=Treponema phagedenis TaxID=162 RepID=UPI0015A44C9A|nr:hypothetical protein [Treponema phagedenis]NVP23207.1 hypothetical protein [Treponema phagedenis]QLC58068.1 hypothetical protein HW453_04060 [Treponema phagedenis]
MHTQIKTLEEKFLKIPCVISPNMKIIEMRERPSVLIEQLLAVWEATLMYANLF